MKLIAKRILKIFFLFLFFIIYMIGIYLLFLSITDYKPKKLENIALNANIEKLQVSADELTLLSWDIGHAGLSKEMDCYFDGGSKVKPSLEIYQKTLNGILNTLSSYSYVDFILLQNVDVFSNRSYFSNQKLLIADYLPEFSYSYAVNNDIQYMLLPLYSPIGRIKSGILTLAKFYPSEIQRHAYITSVDWPKKLLIPDPCFLSTRYKLDNNKQLIVINTQNSKFTDGVQNRREAEELKIFACNEYNKGNYVIVGGDWNINPPGFEKTLSFKNNKLFYLNKGLPLKFTPKAWKWVYDAEIPTNRKTNKAYNALSTLTTVSAFFLISPNIETLSIRNIDMYFEFSDHNPVLMNVKLK